MMTGFYMINEGRDDSLKVVCSREIENATNGNFEAFDLDYANHVTLIRENVVSIRTLAQQEIYQTWESLGSPKS